MNGYHRNHYHHDAEVESVGKYHHGTGGVEEGNHPHKVVVVVEVVDYVDDVEQVVVERNLADFVVLVEGVEVMEVAAHEDDDVVEVVVGGDVAVAPPSLRVEEVGACYESCQCCHHHCLHHHGFCY